VSRCREWCCEESGVVSRCREWCCEEVKGVVL